MGFDRKLERRAAKRAGKHVYIPLLNAPDRRVEIPIGFRDEIFRACGVVHGDLVGKAPIHAVFVVEGLVIAMMTRAGEGVRIALHLVELTDEVNRKAVGSEIYGLWESIKDVLSFGELRLRYGELTGNVS